MTLSYPHVQEAYFFVPYALLNVDYDGKAWWLISSSFPRTITVFEGKRRED